METAVNKHPGVDANYSPIGLGLGALLKALEQEENLGSSSDRNYEEDVPFPPLCKGCNYTEYQTIKLCFGENRNAARLPRNLAIYTTSSAMH